MRNQWEASLPLDDVVQITSEAVLAWSQTGRDGAHVIAGLGIMML